MPADTQNVNPWIPLTENKKVVSYLTGDYHLVIFVRDNNTPDYPKSFLVMNQDQATELITQMAKLIQLNWLELLED